MESAIVVLCEKANRLCEQQNILRELMLKKNEMLRKVKIENSELKKENEKYNRYKDEINELVKKLDDKHDQEEKDTKKIETLCCFEKAIREKLSDPKDDYKFDLFEFSKIMDYLENRRNGIKT